MSSALNDRHVLGYFPDARKSAISIAESLRLHHFQFEIRHFPDGESYVRIPDDLAGKELWIYGSLFPPNDMIVQLLLACSTARSEGVIKIHLISPYLPYMRQDQQFLPGEAVSSFIIQTLISEQVDQLVCIEPHLHRIKDLNDFYGGKARVIRATELLAHWIQKNVKDPVLVGPDSESKQWVSDVATNIDCPFVVLKKVRRGDYSVDIDPGGLHMLSNGQPVLVDDIISSGRTMAEASSLIYNQARMKVLCIGIHAIFAGDAMSILEQNSVLDVVTTNTLQHPTNRIIINSLITEFIRNEIHASI